MIWALLCSACGMKFRTGSMSAPCRACGGGPVQGLTLLLPGVYYEDLPAETRPRPSRSVGGLVVPGRELPVLLTSTVDIGGGKDCGVRLRGLAAWRLRGRRLVVAPRAEGGHEVREVGTPPLARVGDALVGGGRVLAEGDVIWFGRFELRYVLIPLPVTPP